MSKLKSFWIQKKAESGEIRYRKVKGTENPDDLLKKALTGVENNKHVSKMGLEGK